MEHILNSDSSKEVRSKNGKPDADMNNVFNLVTSILPSSSAEDEDSEHEVETRNTTLILLRLLWTRTCGHLESTEQELALLRSISSDDVRHHTTSNRQTEDDTWRLDAPPQSLFSKQGPLLDSSGKV